MTKERQGTNQNLRKRLTRAADAQAFAEGIIETVREPLLVLDGDLAVVHANRQFLDTFHVDRKHTRGQRVYDLGNGQWNIPKLRSLLEEVIPGNTTFDGFEVEHRFPTIGNRMMVLNARRIDQQGGRRRLILLAIQDVTQARMAQRALDASERRHREILEHINSIILSVDTDGHVKWANAFAVKLLGVGGERLIGKRLFGEIVPCSGERDECSRMLHKALEERESFYVQETKIVRKDGSRLLFSWSMKAVRNDQREVTELLVDGNDLTPTWESHERLHRALQLIDNTPDAMARFDRDGQAEFMNDAFRRLSGLQAGGGRSDWPAWLTAAFQRGHEARRAEISEIAVGDCWLQLIVKPAFDERGECVSLMLFARDITTIKQYQDALAHQAQHDPLTGLPNRRLFGEVVALALANSRRTSTRAAVMYLDLDRFKAINDELGHDAGDSLLGEGAARLRHAVRQSDVVARMGGDEFSIVVTNIHGAEDAAEIAADVLAAFGEPFLISGEARSISTSIGISLYPEDGETAEALIASADRALYEAKRQGRNTYRFFSGEMNHRAMRRRTVEEDLRTAMARGELELHYQPQRRLSTGGIVAVEALLRWRHAEWGMLRPADFMTVAEEAGLSLPIGRWVMESACHQLATWQRSGFSLRLSINLSPRQFRHPELERMALETLMTCSVNPAALEFELTEELIMSEVDESEGRLQRLAESGIGFAIDHFGTGCSSLPWLHRLPIRRVKIDKAFVHELDTGPEDHPLIQAIIALSHDLGLAVTAEGVETEKQRSRLAGYGCDEVQGYLTGPPLPVRQIESLFRH